MATGNLDIKPQSDYVGQLIEDMGITLHIKILTLTPLSGLFIDYLPDPLPFNSITQSPVGSFLTNRVCQKNPFLKHSK